MEIAISPRSSVHTNHRFALWAGRALSGLSFLFLAFDAACKLLVLEPVVRATAELGFPAADIQGIGAVLAACTALYAIPRVALVGAVLLTGYLGGAVAAQVRIGAPVSHVLFPVWVGVLVWLGLFLRDPRVRALVKSSNLAGPN